MKIWKLISVLLLACMAGACDDDEKLPGEGDGATEANVEVRFGYEAKTVLKNGGQVQVPVKLTGAVGNVVKVVVSAEQGDADTDAREGIDFNLPEKVLTIPAGDTLVYLAVDVLDNGKTSDDRVVKLNINGVFGGKLGTPSSVSLHIVSNAFVEFEKAKWETYESANVETSSEEIRNSRFVPLTITGELTEEATIVFEVRDSSAVEPTHFTVEKELTVAPGTTKVNVEIKPVDDYEMNDDRVFILKIKEVRGGDGKLIIGSNLNCEVKILSEEVMRKLSWELTSLKKTDREEILDISVRLDKVPLAPFMVGVVATGQSDAVAGVDYEILTPQIEMDFSCRANVKIKVLNNREVNADKLLVLNFVNITDNSVFVEEEAKSFTLGIKNTDFPAFVQKDFAVKEATGNYVVKVEIPAVDRKRTIRVVTKTTGNYANDFFQGVPNVLSVPAGEGSVDLNMNIGFNILAPVDELPTLLVSLTEVDGFVLERPVDTEVSLIVWPYRRFYGKYSLSYQVWTSKWETKSCDFTISNGDDESNINKFLIAKGTIEGVEVTYRFAYDVSLQKLTALKMNCEIADGITHQYSGNSSQTDIPVTTTGFNAIRMEFSGGWSKWSNGKFIFPNVLNRK